MNGIVIDRCSSKDPTLACLARHEATMRGAFWPSTVGWLWSGSLDVLKPWDTCPWCGNGLPVLTPTMLRAMDDPCEVDDEC